MGGLIERWKENWRNTGGGLVSGPGAAEVGGLNFGMELVERAGKETLDGAEKVMGGERAD
jgi:hypothetical protein